MKSIALLGYTLAIVSAVLGFNPASVIVLAIAYILTMVGQNFMYMAAMIFVVSSVRREDVASFSACNGSIDPLIQSTVMFLMGVLIKRVFDGNYGIVFVLASILTTAGLGMFVWLERSRKKAIKTVVDAPAEVTGVTRI